MKPIQRKTRKAFNMGPDVLVANVKDDTVHVDAEGLDLYNEDGAFAYLGKELDTENVEPNSMSDESIKIKALNQAINMAKLMSAVTVDDVIAIAAKVAIFIKG